MFAFIAIGQYNDRKWSRMGPGNVRKPGLELRMPEAQQYVSALTTRLSAPTLHSNI